MEFDHRSSAKRTAKAPEKMGNVGRRLDYPLGLDFDLSVSASVCVFFILPTMGNPRCFLSFLGVI